MNEHYCELIITYLYLVKNIFNNLLFVKRLMCLRSKNFPCFQIKIKYDPFFLFIIGGSKLPSEDKSHLPSTDVVLI